MNEVMRDEILDQPEALRRCLPEFRSQLATLPLKPGRASQILFTGSGDSFFGPSALAYAARRYAGRTVRVLPSMEAAGYWPFSPGDLLVAISISGEGSRTIEAAQVAGQAGASVLAITANGDSTLAQQSDASLLIPFRSRSRKTPHTTDYLTTLLAVATVLEWHAGHRLDPLDTLADLVGPAVTRLEEEIGPLAESVRQKERFYFLGTGPHFATGEYAAAKFWEAGGIRAACFDLEEFAHGPHLVVDPGDPVVLIAPEGKSLDRAAQIGEGLRALGAVLIAVTDRPQALPGTASLLVPAIDEAWSPFLTCLPLQWLCWAVATAKGYDVIKKDGRHADPERYEAIHRGWVRATSGG